MSELTELDPTTARDWVARWDRQQETYLADREDRFTAVIDAVDASAGRPDPLVLDLGAGPGSLSVRLLRRLPQATVIAIDADPVTLALGRSAYGDVAGLRFEDLDLRTPGWVAGLGLEAGRKVDAVVSSTALHWLGSAELRDLYAALAALLRPGGLLLDADHLRLDEADSPVLSSLEQSLEEREALRRLPDGPSGQAEDWDQWWQAVSAHPALAPADTERVRRELVHPVRDGRKLAVHTAALHAAGFAEVGVIWQRGASRLLAAVR
ncbi:class I SAM-dependent methyltransferase [Pseudofrankia asymbiotica]|uniref:Methyltransferase type 11 n=1 Tax=Pseudofrankia asymbiotica TaxID=1834516 RepID=A0A1V2IEW4_9ACTN|nr:class I SAM-dependent methyltransferase [Pseudofrankia asymbiotica]ONH31605.1 methyltransferase type 11 [Pseudofrankia asymbiotica]